jgi:site-specific recombinase XerD
VSPRDQEIEQWAHRNETRPVSAAERSSFDRSAPRSLTCAIRIIFSRTHKVKTVANLNYLSLRTEKAYWQHIKLFILFHQKRHPKDMREGEIRAYLSHLAIEGNVAASTQNVALAALLFLYKGVLKLALDRIDDVERARLPSRLPVVLTTGEVEAVLKNLTGPAHLAAALMYGSGLRLIPQTSS